MRRADTGLSLLISRKPAWHGGRWKGAARCEVSCYWIVAKKANVLIRVPLEKMNEKSLLGIFFHSEFSLLPAIEY